MRKYIATLLLTIVALCSQAQERRVQNRPYTDLRPFHFGVMIGTHFQDMELLNAGPQIIANDDGTTTEAIVSAVGTRASTSVCSASCASTPTSNYV